MNNHDRSNLSRLRTALTAIPFPQDGSGAKTASLEGMVSYQKDMREAVPMICAVFMGMALQGLDDFEEGWDYKAPQQALAILEEWIEKRESESWELMSWPRKQ